MNVTVKLILWGGQATPAPPLGPALGQLGVKIGQFVREFNERTQEQMGDILPVVVTVCENHSFTFVVGKPTTVYLLKKAAEIRKGSGRSGIEKAGSITREQLNRIAETKMTDLNTSSLEAAAKTIAGTARSMGIEIEG